MDPYLRGRISGRRSYVDPIPVGDPMLSGCVGEVVLSNDPALKTGDTVSGGGTGASMRRRPRRTC